MGWYKKYFQKDGLLRGDVNPNYAMLPHSQHVAERIHSVAPDVKIIYLTRDSVKRCLSHMQHYVSMRKEKRPIEQIVNDLEAGVDPFGYISYSKYFYQISEFKRFFNDDQILILNSENLKNKRLETLGILFAFLGISQKEFDQETCITEHHVTAQRRRWPGLVEKLFKHEFIGRWIHNIVLTTKKIMPLRVYEGFRRFLSSAPEKVVLTTEQEDVLRAVLCDDGADFESYLA